jgi:hypothetical protein
VAADVDAALDDRRLVVTTLNRGTLHLVRTDDYWLLRRLTAHRVLPGVERRLRQLGVDEDAEERGVAVIVGSVESEGPLTRHQLRARLDDEGVPTEGQALVHLLTAASLRGLVVRGPMSRGHHAFVSVDRWLGRAPSTLSHAEDLDCLARRYLAGHAPARPDDLAAWAGITLGDARAGFAGLPGEFRRSDDGSVLGAGRSGVPAPGRPRLLGPFDPLLHGWLSREPFVGGHGSVVTTNGIFRAVCLVGGRVVGTWTLPSRGVVIELIEDVDEADRRYLVSDAADVTRFLGHAGGPVTFTGG